jgi:hypothetical protein
MAVPLKHTYRSSLLIGWRDQAHFDTGIQRSARMWMRFLGTGLVLSGLWYGFVSDFVFPMHRKAQANQQHSTPK